MSIDNLPSLVDCAWLAARQSDPDLLIVDCSWYLPDAGRDGAAEYQTGHIAGALFYDLTKNSCQQSALPHTLPSAADFEAQMRALGLNATNAVVVYDGSGEQFSAARLWWQLRVYGHERVALLDGGLPAWKRQGLPISTAVPEPAPGDFRARFRPELLISREQLESELATATTQIVDARGAARFHAQAPEPRPGVVGGHIPGSVNIPYASLSSEQKFLPPEQLRALFAAQRVDLSQPVSCSCGSGVTACVLAFGLHLLGTEARVYDGSWSEWGSLEHTPKAR